MAEEKKHLWGGHLEHTPCEENILFCSGRDIQELPMADEILLPFDIWANRAHCIMLESQGLILPEHLSRILRGLDLLEQKLEQDGFRLDPALEDVHTNVEAFVSEHEGAEAGGRMHIGRSRNDQSACDMRLFLRSRALQLFEETKKLAEIQLKLAEKHTESVMPGFTHYQPAMITTWGHWLCAYVQGLNRDLERLAFSLELVNRNPLGAAAAFGTSWSLDRLLTTELLGFEKLETNSLDCIVSRWENEAQLAFSCSMLINRLSVMSQDLIVLGLPYLDMLGINEAFVTGSSIMPQKKNPDFAEVIRSKAAICHGQLQSLLGVQKGALSGYNRDSQLTKYVIMDVVRECEPVAGILYEVFRTLEVKTESMRKHCETGFMNAVDLADLLTRECGLPFRESHNILSRAVKFSAPSKFITEEALREAFENSGYDAGSLPKNLKKFQDPAYLVSCRQHSGSPAPEQVRIQVDELREGLEQSAQPLNQVRRRIDRAYLRCRNASKD